MPLSALQNRALAKTGNRPHYLNRANRRPVTMPDRGVGPHVKLVFAEMARLHFTYDEVEEGSGVRRPTIKQWRRKNRPALDSLEAVLGFLGWDFVAVPAMRCLPPEMAGWIATLAAKLGRTMPETWAALIDIGVTQKLLHMDAAERRAVIEARTAVKTGVKRQYRRRKPAANDNIKRSTESAA
jgi:hypothetical protein